MKIVILGPKGTYSEKAANQSDAFAEKVFCKNIPDVVEKTENEDDCIAIVPVENSLEGSIPITLDLFRETKLSMIGEINVHVKHCLVMKGSKEDVSMIYSHWQALAQCRRYLREKFPHAQIYEANSTADAAHKASLAKHIAAIASEEAANEYGLKIYEKNIQDVNENYTRFIVLGRKIPEPSGNDKTSIIVDLERNKPGALFEILREFADRGIDLTKIESRPTKRMLGEYVFYLDAKGHENNPDGKIRDTIQAIKKIAQVSVLGSYPIGPIVE